MEEVSLGTLSKKPRRARERAWKRLYDEHASMVYRFSIRLGVTPSEAEDVVQRVFVIAYERLARLTHDRSLGGWLRGITVRVVSDRRRWRRVRQLKQWLVRSAHEPDPVAAPDDELDARKTRARVAKVMGQLSPKLAPVLALTDLEGCSPTEAGEILGIPLNTVRSRRRLARERFRQLWDAYDG